MPIAIMFVLFATLVALLTNDTDPPHQADPSGDQIRNVTLGEQVFSIPASHFRSRYRGDIEIQAVNLYLAWPHLRWESQEELFRELAIPGNERRITVLISANIDTEDLANGNIFSRSFESAITRSGTVVYEFTGQHHGLHRYLWAGLPRSPTAEEVYVAPSAENIQSIIHCTNERAPEFTPFVYPSCRHWFAHLNILFILTYQRNLLPQWQQIETETRSLFSQYHHSVTETSPPEPGEYQ